MKFLLSIFLLISSIVGYAQVANVTVRASVKTEDGNPLKNAIIQTFKDDLLLRSDTSLSNGRINNVRLPVGANYKFVISKPGYVSKIAALDVRLPASLMPEDNYALRFSVSLFEECDAGDYEFMKTESIIDFKLDSVGLEISYDKGHLKKMMKKVEEAKYANLSVEDQSAFKKYFEVGLAYMGFEKYDEALELLVKAKEIVSCSHVIETFDECSRLQKRQAAYNKFIASADSLYAIGKYQEAKNVYHIAGNIKEDEPYPAKQLALIQYQKVVAKADEYFEAKDYKAALKYYDRAARLKPDDKSFAKKHKKCRRKAK